MANSLTIVGNSRISDWDAASADSTRDAGKVVNAGFVGVQKTRDPDPDLMASASMHRVGDFDVFEQIELPIDGLARNLHLAVVP